MGNVVQLSYACSCILKYSSLPCNFFGSYRGELRIIRLLRNAKEIDPDVFCSKSILQLVNKNLEAPQGRISHSAELARGPQELISNPLVSIVPKYD